MWQAFRITQRERRHGCQRQKARGGKKTAHLKLSLCDSPPRKRRPRLPAVRRLAAMSPPRRWQQLTTSIPVSQSIDSSGLFWQISSSSSSPPSKLLRPLVFAVSAELARVNAIETRLRQRFFFITFSLLFFFFLTRWCRRRPANTICPRPSQRHSVYMNTRRPLTCLSSVLTCDEAPRNHTTSPRKCARVHLCAARTWVEEVLIKAA